MVIPTTLKMMGALTPTNATITVSLPELQARVQRPVQLTMVAEAALTVGAVLVTARNNAVVESAREKAVA